MDGVPTVQEKWLRECCTFTYDKKSSSDGLEIRESWVGLHRRDRAVLYKSS